MFRQQYHCLHQSKQYNLYCLLCTTCTVYSDEGSEFTLIKAVQVVIRVNNTTCTVYLNVLFTVYFFQQASPTILRPRPGQSLTLLFHDIRPQTLTIVKISDMVATSGPLLYTPPPPNLLPLSFPIQLPASDCICIFCNNHGFSLHCITIHKILLHLFS